MDARDLRLGHAEGPEQVERLRLEAIELPLIGRQALLHEAPIELNVDRLTDRLLRTLDREGARRLVIDSVAGLERAAAEAGATRRAANYLAALVDALGQRAITTVLTKENGTLATAGLDLSADLVSAVAENVIWLQQVTHRERLHRVLSVPKMRSSGHGEAMLPPFTEPFAESAAEQDTARTAG